MADPTTPITPGTGDATMDMLAANGATVSPAPAPQKPSRLKSMLMNFAEGMGKSLQYQAGVPQFNQLQAETATAQAKLPYVAPQMEAQTREAQANAAMTEALTKPVTIPLPGPNGETTERTVPGWLAKIIAPQTVRYQQALDVAGMNNQTKMNVAKMQQGMPLTVDSDVATLAGQPQLAGQQVGKGTLDNLNKALGMKGYKMQDLGNEGMWLIDRAGNKIKRVGESPSVARATAFAAARAANTPFETVDAEGNPTTISQAQALQSGAPGIGKTNLTQVRGKEALINDIRGGVEQVRQYSNILDRGPDVRLKIAALLADPGLTRQSLVQSPIANSLKPDEQQYVINLLNLKENAMAMRSVLGAGQGSEDLRSAITKTIPNAMTPGSKYANAQLDTFLGTLDRLSKGIPSVKAPSGGPKKQPSSSTTRPPLSSFESK